MSTQKTRIPNTPDGDIFEVGGIQFIRFPSVNGKTPAVTKEALFTSRFGSNNDLRKSDVLKKLEADFLPKIIDAVGEESLHTIHTDLTTLDGLKPYGEMESLVSLTTLDFYRKHVDIFDRYKVNRWWYLATPESAEPHRGSHWVLCVSPSGFIDNDNCYHGRGVRPVLLFDSSIFESSAE